MKSNSKKVVFASSIALLLLLLGVFSVNATIDCNITVPTTVQRNTVLNVTYNASATTGVVTASFEAQSASTVNSSWAKIANVSNASNRYHINVTFLDAFQFVDASNYQFRAICYENASDSSAIKATEQNTATTLTGRTIDRGNPEVNGVSTPVTGASTNLYTVTFGFRNATQWVLVHNSNTGTTTSVTGNFVNTSSSQQISLSDSGSYYIQVSDGTDTANSATISYTMAGNVITAKATQPAAKAKVAQQQKKAESKKSSTNVLLIGVVVVIFVVIGGILMSPKVKRRR